MPGPRPFSFSVGERKIMNHFVAQLRVAKKGLPCILDQGPICKPFCVPVEGGGWKLQIPHIGREFPLFSPV
jgi:hypothetical protein